MNPLAFQVRGTLPITFNRQFLEMRRSGMFRRQMSKGPYIVDFFFPECKVAMN
jgi:hypothetical protein